MFTTVVMYFLEARRTGLLSVFCFTRLMWGGGERSDSMNSGDWPRFNMLLVMLGLKGLRGL